MRKYWLSTPTMNSWTISSSLRFQGFFSSPMQLICLRSSSSYARSFGALKMAGMIIRSSIASCKPLPSILALTNCVIAISFQLSCFRMLLLLAFSTRLFGPYISNLIFLSLAQSYLATCLLVYTQKQEDEKRKRKWR